MYIFDSRYDPIDDVFYLYKRQHFLQLPISYTSNLRLNIIDIFRIICQKSLEILFTNSSCQFLQLRYQFIPNPPSELIRYHIEIRL